MIIPFSKITLADIKQVGGKVASLGEMIKHLKKKKINTPDGFCIPANVFNDFLVENHVDTIISSMLHKLNVKDVTALNKASKKIKNLIMGGKFTVEQTQTLKKAYERLVNKKTIRVAVRSSATCEDSATASFAGLHDTILHVTSFIELVAAIKKVFASMYNARAIGYRVDKGFDESRVSMAVGVQKMVNSDSASSGVAFTIDTETGFDKVILINSSYGLGEAVVSGQVNPDEFVLYKPNLRNNKDPILRRTLGGKNQKIIFTKKKLQTVEVPNKSQIQLSLTDKQAILLAKQALIIEDHYKKPMDIEWAIDSKSKKLFIVQARPETVQSQNNRATITQYKFTDKGKVLCVGRSVGGGVGQGSASVISDLSEMEKFKPGSILVTDITNPDWEPIMKQASAIVTNRGGRTCHAAIIARELGIPAVVGTTDGTTKIKHKEPVTVSCAEGDEGYIYKGLAKFKVDNISVKKMPKIPVNISMNLGNPDMAFDYQFIPNKGVGLARIEFIISNMIGVHPNACLQFKTLEKSEKNKILKIVSAYKSPKEFYIERLKEGMSIIAAAFYPKEVIFRFSDFKSNEYANLLGGSSFEPLEENPMLGYRGAGRYVSEQFKDAFKLECEAVKRVREQMGLTNAQVMIPFTRTVAEAKEVLKSMKKNGLVRGKKDLKVYMMCEIPSNVVLANEFLEHFDGFSIGSNDLTQLTFGIDRDSELVAPIFDERNPAMKKLLSDAIKACRKANKYVGICGQGPSDYPDFAEWLLEQKISSISLTPDSIVSTWLHLAKKIKRKK